MGTRSLTHFINVNTDTDKPKKTKIVTMYRQMDGYPRGHGVDLAEFLAKGKLVNGYSLDETELVFNGMGCLAAQVVAEFKKGTGGIYLERGGASGMWEEYVYEVIGNEDGDNDSNIILKCFEVRSKKRKLLFEGSPKDFVTKFQTQKVS